jgi:serine/threonine protein kinase
VSQRSFEGYRYGVPLEAEFYGHAYRAYAPSGAEVRLLEVGPTFTAHQEFAATFLARGKLLGNFEHLNVVRTHVVGRSEQGGLVAVTDAVPGRVRLESLLGGATATEMRPMPRAAAVSVAMALLEGLAAAHDRSIVHGALHPRSVLIDSQGTIRIDDFAVGRALATWSERDSAASFVKAFGGFLAPELTQGARPDASTDVFAAAAVVLAVTTGRLSLAAVGRELPAAVTTVLARALDTNRLHRYANAKRLRDDLKGIWKAEGWTQGTSDELCAYMEQRQHRAQSVFEQEAELDQETEDVLSFLGDIATPPPAAPELVDAVNSMLAELDDEEPTPPATPARASAPANPATASATRSAPATPATASAPPRPVTPGATPRPVTPGAPATPAPAGPTVARAASAEVALSALADLDEDTGQFGAISRRPNTVTPLPSPPRPSSEEFSFSARADLDGNVEDDMPQPRRLTHTPQPDSLRASSQDIAMAALADLDDDEDEPRPMLPVRRSGSVDSAPHSQTPAPRPQTPAPRPQTPAPRPQTPAPRPQTPMPSPAPASAPAPARPSAVSVVAIPPPDGFGSDDTTLAIKLGRRRGLGPVLWLLLVVAGAGALFWVVRQQSALREQSEASARDTEARQRELLDKHMAAQPKNGHIVIDSEPAGAAAWMLLGRTPLQTDKLSGAMVHELRLELDGYQPQDLRVVGKHWRGEGETLHAEVAARLQPGTLATPLPAYPPEPPPEALQGLLQGEGSIHVTSEPPGAQVWLLVGITPGVDVSVTVGAEYELELLKDGYLPAIVVVRADDWKDAEDQSVPRSITLQRQPKKR